MIRITGGQLKGHRIKVPRGARPTTERVRQTIFSILGTKVKGAVVLDLFCGSGVLGLEALSRGAEFVFFVDSSRAAVELVEENLQRLGLYEKGRVKRSSFIQGLKSLKNKMMFDVIFADPPYGYRGIGELLKLVDGSTVLKGGGYLIIEHARKQKMPETFGALKVVKKRDFGGTTITIYQKEG